MNGPFRAGDLARILVKPHRDRVARVCEVWPEQQTARLEVGQETRRFGEDTFGWHQLAKERDAEPPVAADTMRLIVRPYRSEDFGPINDVWRRARVTAFPEFQARKGHTAEEDRRYFQNVILVKDSVLVAEVDGRAVGFMAIAGDLIDQLYVDPENQGQGVGTSLIASAKALSPSGLRLFTFETNARGRAFYEKHGFRATAFGISPPPESEPHVEYRWTPCAAAHALT
jgi:ribosomal protein S18 acetylase RimI-like enzyme